MKYQLGSVITEKMFLSHYSKEIQFFIFTASDWTTDKNKIADKWL